MLHKSSKEEYQSFKEMNISEATNTTLITNVTLESTTSGWKIYGQVIPIIVIVFGFLGNWLVVIILQRIQREDILKTSTGFYMKALAVSDNYVMVLFLVRWLNNIPSSPVPRNTKFCIFYFFFARLGLSISAWILACMTIDRYIALRCPLKALAICTIWRAKIASFAVIVIQVIGHVPYFWRRFDPEGHTLSEKCEYDFPNDYIEAYEIIRMVVFDRVLPCLITLCLAIALTFHLRHLAILRRPSVTSPDGAKLRREITIMSLSVAWTFNLLTFPSTIYESLRLLMDLKMPAEVYELFIFFLYLNSAVNFYLYLLVYGKFRKELKSLLRECTGQRGSSVATIDMEVHTNVGDSIHISLQSRLTLSIDSVITRDTAFSE